MKSEFHQVIREVQFISLTGMRLGYAHFASCIEQGLLRDTESWYSRLCGRNPPVACCRRTPTSPSTTETRALSSSPTSS